MESLDQEDFLGVIDLLLPGERDTFSEPAQELVSELTRLEVLTEDASLSDLTGLRRHPRRPQRPASSATNVDDIVNITMVADAHRHDRTARSFRSVTLVTDSFGEDVDLGELDTTESGLDFQFPMTAVEKDGRWYLSVLLHDRRERSGQCRLDDIPETGIEPQGADSPEGAVDVLLGGRGGTRSHRDHRQPEPERGRGAATLCATVHRRAPSRSSTEIPLTLNVADIEYEVEGDGSTRSVAVKQITHQRRDSRRSARRSPSA